MLFTCMQFVHVYSLNGQSFAVACTGQLFVCTGDLIFRNLSHCYHATSGGYTWWQMLAINCFFCVWKIHRFCISSARMATQSCDIWHSLPMQQFSFIKLQKYVLKQYYRHIYIISLTFMYFVPQIQAEFAQCKMGLFEKQKQLLMQEKRR